MNERIRRLQRELSGLLPTTPKPARQQAAERSQVVQGDGNYVAGRDLVIGKDQRKKDSPK